MAGVIFSIIPLQEEWGIFCAHASKITERAYAIRSGNGIYFCRGVIGIRRINLSELGFYLHILENSNNFKDSTLNPLPFPASAVKCNFL